MLVDPPLEQLEVVDALRAADELPVALGEDEVGGQHPGGVARDRLHVERLGLGGPALDEHRLLAALAEHRLVRGAEVVAPLELLAAAREVLEGLVVGDALVAALGRRLQLRDVAAEHLQLGGAPLDHPANQVGDELLLQVEVAVVVEEGDLRFDHPELEQVPAGLALLGPEGRSEGVDLAERHRPRLGVELSRLRKVGGVLVEQVDLEEVGGALHRGRHEERGVEAHEAALAEELVDGALDLVADAHDGPRAAVPEVEMAVLEEEVDAVLLRRDRVVVAGSDEPHLADAELDAAGRALVGAHHARHLEARLLRQLLGRLELLLGHLALDHHPLDEAAAVTKLQERDLAA